MKTLRCLSVASEIYPLVKTGGLADVAGALPLALVDHGMETRTLLPGYPSVKRKLRRADTTLSFDDLLGVRATLLSTRLDGLDLLVLDAPELFERDGGPYEDAAGKPHGDNWKRFAALSKAGAEIAAGALETWRPDIVHAHDWQAAMTPVYMRHGPAHAVSSVMTVHNLAFQGQFSADLFPELGLPGEAFGLDGIEYYGGIGYLKGGLQTAHAITTVSPTYAREIATPERGMGLDGLIAARAGDLHGIVNGIDTDVWNPASDRHLVQTYDAANLKKRDANRKALAARMDLDTDGPLFGVVSRLTWQKGMDILAETVDTIVERGGRLAVLGSGDEALEGAFRAAVARHRGRVGAVFGYDETLSHLMQAGSDAILVPSRFEPCGLTQLYAMRYGAVPVVARTGGLADTVIDANAAALSAGVATGFQFSPVDAGELRHTIGRVFTAYRDPKVWTRLQRQGMKADVSWERSATGYADLYKTVIKQGQQ